MVKYSMTRRIMALCALVGFRTRKKANSRHKSSGLIQISGNGQSWSAADPGCKQKGNPLQEGGSTHISVDVWLGLFQSISETHLEFFGYVRRSFAAVET
jgi:hypothetical protein